MPTIYSHSRLSSFENCKKQFHFRYILQIPAESEGVEAFVGKLVHEVLERLYRFIQNDQVPPLDRVVQRYHTMWEERFDGARIRIVKDLPLHYYQSLGVRCIENYYRRHYPFDGDETLGLESRVAFDLDEAGRYKIQGFIDRIVRADDGAVEVHDYKTGQYIPSQKRLDEERQLALYQIGLGDRFGDEQPFRLVWHYLSKGQVRTSERTPEQLDALRQDTIRLIDRVEAETEFAPTKIKLCDWCEYRNRCPAFHPESLAAEAGQAPTSPPEPISPTAPGAAVEAREPDASSPDPAAAAAHDAPASTALPSNPPASTEPSKPEEQPEPRVGEQLSLL